MIVFEIIFFSTDAGRRPLGDFLYAIDVKMRNKVGSGVTSRVCYISFM